MERQSVVGLIPIHSSRHECSILDGVWDQVRQYYNMLLCLNILRDLLVNAEVNGSVPRQIAVIVSNIAQCIPEMKRRLNDDIKKQTLVVWKKSHFEKLRVDFNKTCKSCSTSGGNWKVSIVLRTYFINSVSNLVAVLLWLWENVLL